MLNVRAPDKEPLPPSEVDGADLRPDDSAVAQDAHEHVEVLRGLRYGRKEVELLGLEYARAELEERIVVRAQKVDLVGRQLRAHVARAYAAVRACGGRRRRGEQQRERAADGPVEVLEALEAVVVVREQAALVAEDGGLVEDDVRRDVQLAAVAAGEPGHGGLDEGLELALLADDLPDEDVVVFEQRVGRGRAAGLGDELGGELAELAGGARHRARRWRETSSCHARTRCHSRDGTRGKRACAHFGCVIFGLS